MRLSCSTRCIPDYSFHQALRAIAEAGYRYLETFTRETGAALDPAIVHTVRIKETFAHHRLALSSLGITPLAPAAPANAAAPPPEAEQEHPRAAMPGPTEVPGPERGLRAEVVMARELWLDVVSVATGTPAASPWPALVAALRQAADYASGLGISLAVANAPGTHVVTVEDAERLLAAVDRPNVGVALDLPRYHLAGQDPASAIERLAARTLLVRTGDVAAGRWAPPGSGELDHPRLLGRLAEAGYNGFVIVELQTPARAEVEGLMARAREFLDPLMRV